MIWLCYCAMCQDAGTHSFLAACAYTLNGQLRIGMDDIPQLHAKGVGSGSINRLFLHLSYTCLAFLGSQKPWLTAVAPSSAHSDISLCLVYSLSSHLPACLPVAPPEDLLETQPHGKPALTRALALLGRTPSAAFTLLLIHWTAGAPAGLSAAPQFDSSVGGTQWDGTLGNLCRPAPPKPSLP